MKIFCLFDKKAGEYSCLSVYPNIAMFTRSLAPEVNSDNPRNLLCTNAADFDIFCVGEIDSKSGIISPDHQFIMCCSDLKETVAK